MGGWFVYLGGKPQPHAAERRRLLFFLLLLLLLLLLLGGGDEAEGGVELGGWVGGWIFFSLCVWMRVCVCVCVGLDGWVGG